MSLSLFEENQDLAQIIAARMASRSVPTDALLGPALEGLWRAAQRYDPSRKVAFRTYAAWKVRGAIQDWMRSEDWQSRTMRRQVSTLTLTSLDAADEEGQLLVEPIDPQPAPGGALELRDLLDSERAALPWVDRLILRLYYDEHLVMREISVVLGLSESRIGQRHSAILERLRQSMELRTRLHEGSDMGLHRFESISWRWLREADGSELALTTKGRLLERRAGADWLQLHSACAYEAALIHAQLHDYQPAALDADARPICRHCQRCRALKGAFRRGLCFACYGDGAVRRQYEMLPNPNREKYARRGVGIGGTGATVAPATEAPPGTPAKVAVLEARVVAHQHLHNPEDITVDRGEYLRRLAQNLGPGDTYAQACNHAREDGLEISREEWRSIRQELDLVTDAERHAAERGPSLTRHPSPPTPPSDERGEIVSETNGHAPATPITNHEKGICIRAAFRELGPEATFNQLNERLAREGLSCSDKSWKLARSQLWPERYPSTTPGQQPITPAIAAAPPPVREPTPQPVPVPAPAPSSLALVLRQFAAAVRSVGGIGQARALLEELAALQEGGSL